MPKFQQERCEVCHEPVTDIMKLPPEIRDRVYKPGEDESYYKEIKLDSNTDGFGGSAEENED